MRSAAIILLLLANQAICQVQGTWSGTITYEVIAKTITGNSRKTFNITIQKNVVTGTMTGVDSTIIEGKFYEEESCTGMGGLGELMTVWIYEDGHYDINVESPEFHCTKYEGGYGDPGRVNAAVSTKWATINRKVLTGKDGETMDLGGLGTQTTSISWNLVSADADDVLLVSPVDYNNWKPIPGQDELLKGNAMGVNLKVQNKNGGPPVLNVLKFEVRLNGTSQEPGTTINYPLQPKYQFPDLRLLPDIRAESAAPDQYMEISPNGSNTGIFFIGSYDGGGWTDLTVTAVLEGGLRIDGHLFNATGVTTIPIPKRKPGSHIADSWLQANGNPGELDDIEKGNSHPGDGLTAYEEYRGVWHESQHERLLPSKKELGIVSDKNKWHFFEEGVSWFEAASGVKVIKFMEDEIDTDRRINRNSETSKDYKQFVLKIDTGATTKGANGENRPVDLDYMLPYQSEEVVINISFMEQFYPEQERECQTNHFPMPYTLHEMIASAVAHEIAHGVNVNHHGDPVASGGRSELWEGSGNNHVFDWFGKEVPVSQWPLDNSLQKHHFKIEGNMGAPAPKGGPEAGNMNCFMCYTSYFNWSFVQGANGSLNYYMVPPVAFGKILCSDKKPTGINLKPQFFGAAVRGDCLSQIQFR